MRTRPLRPIMAGLAALVLAATACAPVVGPLLPGVADKPAVESPLGADTRAVQPLPAPAGPKVAVGAPQAPATAPGQQAAQQSTVDLAQRLIVQTASLVLLVDEVPEAATQARHLADSLGGFVVTATQREENSKPAATVTIRVPADRFDEAIDKLKGLAAQVNNEQVSSKDVTEEFVDTDARLRNLRATESRYLELLQQARTVDDILKIEQQLTNVRAQIEQLQGRLQYLQRSAQMSVITAELRPFAGAQAAPASWSLLPVLRSAWAALVSTLQLGLAAIIWLLVFVPIWAPVGYAALRWRRRRSRPAIVPTAPAA
jgi:hypothetical protein